MPELKKYVFRKYSKRFPALFTREKYRIRRILGKGPIIEHCGSTAVPGLGGKGIIDIYVSVRKKDWKKSREMLKKAGYMFYPEEGSKRRYYFDRDYAYSGSVRRVHIHLVFDRNSDFRKAVSFVKYLKNHPEAVKEYESVKRKAAKYCRGKGKLYKIYKKDFIEKTTIKALEEH
jgi:GrpB-like predicted nucleotidyltransferase (UPF0157 family)